MSDLGYSLFDCDHHFYETRDSFTRFMEPRFRDQAVRPVVGEDGTEVVMVGDKLLTFLLGHDLYDNAGAPGSLKEKLLLMKKGGGDMEYGQEPIWPEWRDRDARIERMNAQDVEGCLMFPNVAVVVEHFMETSEQLYANLRAFNRWLDEDWGYVYQERIFTPPMLSLRDLDLAITELDQVLADGARCIAMKAGPAYGRNPADPYFDPFWERVNEAGVSVAFHLGEVGYNEMFSTQWGEEPNPPNFDMSAWQWAHCYCDRPMMETLSAFIYANFFARFPNIQLISVEHGCEWVPYLLKRLDKMGGMGGRDRGFAGSSRSGLAPSSSATSRSRRLVRTTRSRSSRRSARRTASCSAATGLTPKASRSPSSSPTDSTGSRPNNVGTSCARTASRSFLPPRRDPHDARRRTWARRHPTRWGPSLGDETSTSTNRAIGTPGGWRPTGSRGSSPSKTCAVTSEPPSGRT